MTEKMRAVYKCRNCGEKFEAEAFILGGDWEINGQKVPNASVYGKHKCENGMFGVGDLVATYCPGGTS